MKITNRETSVRLTAESDLENDIIHHWQSGMAFLSGAGSHCNVPLPWDGSRHGNVQSVSVTFGPRPPSEPEAGKEGLKACPFCTGKTYSRLYIPTRLQSPYCPNCRVFIEYQKPEATPATPLAGQDGETDAKLRDLWRKGAADGDFIRQGVLIQDGKTHIATVANLPLRKQHYAAQLICAAVNNLPRLLDEKAALERDLAETRKERDERDLVLSDCITLLPSMECKCIVASPGGYTCPRCETISAAKQVTSSSRVSTLREKLAAAERSFRQSIEMNGKFRSDVLFAMAGTREHHFDETIIATAKDLRAQLAASESLLKEYKEQVGCPLCRQTEAKLAASESAREGMRAAAEECAKVFDELDGVTWSEDSDVGPSIYREAQKLVIAALATPGAESPWMPIETADGDYKVNRILGIERTPSGFREPCIYRKITDGSWREGLNPINSPRCWPVFWMYVPKGIEKEAE